MPKPTYGFNPNISTYDDYLDQQYENLTYPFSDELTYDESLLTQKPLLQKIKLPNRTKLLAGAKTEEERKLLLEQFDSEDTQHAYDMYQDNGNTDMDYLDFAADSSLVEKSIGDGPLKVGDFMVGNADKITLASNAANNIASMFSRGQSTYEGPHGDLRAAVDLGWNTVSDAVGLLGPYGKAALAGMAAVNALNSIQGAIFGATDGMTKTDALLDSPLGFLTGVGWINQAFGLKSDTITKNDEAFAQTGAAYGGSNALVDEALDYSGKKYGTFSSGARKDANALIAEARRLQNMVADIGSTATTRFNLLAGMSAINSNGRAFNMLGGYQLNAIHVGRNGFSFNIINRAKEIIKIHQQGGLITDPFDEYLKTLPKSQLDSTDFRVRDYWEFNGRPKNFNEAVKKEMFTLQSDGWHANSVAENPKTGEIEFMKSSSHPSHHMEVDWYNSDDASEFRSKYELQKTEPYWKYVKRSSKVVEKHKEGGLLKEVSFALIPEEFLNPLIIEEVSFDSIPSEYLEDIKEIEEFQKGGKVNVIPEGALHARLHHMENADNLTKKGIPVVAEKEGGELEQQAEIERNEVILRLSVTLKLEELKEKYESDKYTLKEKDEFAILAGKLLTYELLENTVDNTGLIDLTQ